MYKLQTFTSVNGCLKLCMVWRTRVTININMNSKLAGTTMGKNSSEGVVALKRAGLVSWLCPQVYYSFMFIFIVTLNHYSIHRLSFFVYNCNFCCLLCNERAFINWE